MRSRLAIVAAALAIAAFYAPAVNRVFAADQIWYFAETAHARTFASRLAMADYDLVRRYWRGEEKLFRPLLISGLAIERQLFGTDHRKWNAANILFHLLTTLMLYRLLARIAPDGFAGWLALLFGVMRSNAELVAWNHIGGYMIAFALMLACASILLDILDDRARTSAPAMYAALMTLAAFLYEPISVFALLIAVAATRRANARMAPFLFAPVVLFVLAYSVHALACDRFFGGAVAGRSDAVTLAAAPRAIAVMASSFLVAGILPAAVKIGVEPFQRFEITFAGASLSPEFILNALLVVALVVLLAPSLGRNLSPRRRAVAILASAMALAYLAIITLGRTVDNARENTYYAYLFNILAVVALHALASAPALGTRRRLVAAALGAFVILQGAMLWGVTSSIHAANAEADAYFSGLHTFEAAHDAEVGFSMRIDEPGPARVDPEIVLTRGFFDDPEAPRERARVSRLIFGAEWSENDPRYTLRWRDGAWSAEAARNPHVLE